MATLAVVDFFSMLREKYCCVSGKQEGMESVLAGNERIH
jgi:hypothetical protein